MANVIANKMTTATDAAYFVSGAYFESSTSANYPAKSAIGSCTFSNQSLVTGVTVHVKFVNSNTASSPTLAVGTSTSKPIVRYGTTPPGVTESTSWHAGAVVSLTYDGTRWVMNDWINSAGSATEHTTYATANYYGTFTSGDSAQQVLGVTITPTTTNFSLVAGSHVYVPTNANVSQFGSLYSYMLNVNSTGNVFIKYKGSQLGSGIAVPKSGVFTAGTMLDFLYDGTYWNLVGEYLEDFDTASTQKIVYCRDITLTGTLTSSTTSGKVYTYTTSTASGILSGSDVLQFSLGSVMSIGTPDSTWKDDLFFSIGSQKIVVSGALISGYYLNTTKTRWSAISLSGSTVTIQVAVPASDDLAVGTTYARVWYTLS